MNIFSKYQTTIISSIFLIILILLIGWIISLVSYFDPLALCKITLNVDVLRGNKDTLQKAIASLKDDKQAYQDLCRNIDMISEEYCLATQPVKGTGQWGTEGGCYIKGSKTIYLDPNSEKSEYMIQKRAQLIKKYSQKSKEFWQDKK
jgi:hypothetical protein